MRLALIPPRGMEHETLRMNTHMALAQNNWPEYNKAYNEARDRNDYIIVDNGAAEGKSVPDSELMYSATRLHANEIVVPDSMRRYDETIERMEVFFKNATRVAYVGDYRYMGVAQGINRNEVLSCVAKFAENVNIRTIGIPRHLIQTIHLPGIRLELATEIASKYPSRFQIHLLGTDRSYLREVFYAGKYYSWIRSVDTSAPFIYALAGKLLPRSPKGPVDHLERAPGYFDQLWQANAYTIGHNVEVLNAWSRGQHGS